MKDFWKDCCDRLRLDARLGGEKYSNWIEPLQMQSWDPENGVLTLAAPSSPKKEVTRDTYGEIIAFHAQRANDDQPVKIIWTVQEASPVRSSMSSAPVRPEQKSQQVSDQLAKSCGLMTELSFENFVSGLSNNVALGAAMYVASHPGTKSYNPLYIYGGVGLGKTHLMHAIGLEVLKRNPRARVLCISANSYISEFMKAIKNQDQGFYQSFNSLDLLLLDDVQMLGARGGTQNAFFSTFESLVSHGKQIVLTSDTYARQLKDVDERLKSRFAGGMSVPIDPPELETRQAILMKKAEQRGKVLPENVAFFIAKHMKSNVRELEGALQQVIAHAQFNGIEISIEQAKVALHDIITPNDQITVQDIQKKVADYYKIRVADMHSKRRPKQIAVPRQIAMYLSKKLTQKSYPEIGELFGGKDHTTVIYACQKIETERRTNEELNHELHVLEQNIQSF
ncbi:chromosomal replication initiator protein DnaA [Mesosutterella sp. OilRF-GAM-744-9]|uniref:Chromosomal replication initiator protein DnaA n=1 Tax=Mesosutterella porci TaxID=2915351 RepID=A0ABS9MRF8_9BURK|nr:chromosomal replication initiator protein DnaA [Mesosutterella sp. oilRF-744-WT-GAM-9]MCG5031211.1 chromosomal replication initiator protein DnaA [Mesosutterella sp. oilRF-744-WT-GAM-9]MCI6529816.1 chromosomal replication initiator protein DnaA [Mesosutterella sp.]